MERNLELSFQVAIQIFLLCSPTPGFQDFFVTVYIKVFTLSYSNPKFLFEMAYLS